MTGAITRREGRRDDGGSFSSACAPSFGYLSNRELEDRTLLKCNHAFRKKQTPEGKEKYECRKNPCTSTVLARKKKKKKQILPRCRPRKKQQSLHEGWGGEKKTASIPGLGRNKGRKKRGT